MSCHGLILSVPGRFVNGEQRDGHRAHDGQGDEQGEAGPVAAQRSRSVATAMGTTASATPSAVRTMPMTRPMRFSPKRSAAMSGMIM